MRLLIMRHGNTFGPDQQGGERVFMAGSRNNIPLVASGRRQARAMAAYLDQLSVFPTAFYSSSLLRTWETATILREHFYHLHHSEIPFYLHEGLMEFDYGEWAGLLTKGSTVEDNEVIARFGLEAWENWQKRRIMPPPEKGNWQIGPKEMKEGVSSFLEHIASSHKQEDFIVAVGSQGSVSFLNACLEGGMEKAIEKQEYQVKTGCFCELVYDGKEWKKTKWNQNPYSIKCIKLMPEWGCWPIWSYNGGFIPDNIDPSQLPLSHKTVARLSAWAKTFESWLNHDYPPDSVFPPLELDQFEKEGRALWKCLQVELGKEYQVLYRSLKLDKLLIPE